jgi:integrase-like protein
MRRFHDEIREGHPGIARTMEKIQRNYYFPGMYRKVKKYISKCDSCQRNKNDYTKPHGTLVQDEKPPTEPWKRLTADFLEMPEATSITGTEKYDELLFSKMTILIPTRKTATCEEIFQLLWERVFSIFGIPEDILSDRDKIFKTDKWQRLMRKIGSKQRLSTAHHQQTDGQTERKIQELRAYLRHYLDYEQTNWIEITPLAQLAVNDAISATTGETPQLITFGTNRINGKDQRITESDATHTQTMQVIHRKVELDMKWTKEKAKEYYDRNRRATPKFKTGDNVYIRRRTSGEKTYNIKTERTSQKLDCVKRCYHMTTIKSHYQTECESTLSSMFLY